MTALTAKAINEIHTKCNNAFFREESSTWHCVGCGTKLADDRMASIAAHQTEEVMKLLAGGEPSHKTAKPHALLAPAEDEAEMSVPSALTRDSINALLAFHDLDGDTTSDLFMCKCKQGYMKWSDFVSHQSTALWQFILDTSEQDRIKVAKLLFTHPVSDGCGNTAPEIIAQCEAAADMLLKAGYRKVIL